MTPEKILEVVGRYKQLWPTVYPHSYRDRPMPSRFEQIQHLNYMLLSIELFVREGRIEKAFRWLGFAQGILWTLGSFSIEELGEHNKP